MKGTVIKNTGSWFTVKTENYEIKACKIKGVFRLKEIKTTNPIAVGDVVEIEDDQIRLKEIRTTNPIAVGDVVEIEDDQNGSVITKILERKNYIIRKSSNLSKQAQIIAALIVTVAYPETYTTFIDRFLASAEAYNIPACIIINKIDLYDKQEKEYAESLKNLYETIGYKIFLISALDKNTITDFQDFIKDKTTLLSGNSGVGKSTIINQLIPNLNTRTNIISDFHKKGMHTTTFSEMFELPNGGAIIDTPGIKGFGLIEINENEVGHYFKEIFEFSKNCKFHNCTHVHEPKCAVTDAVEKNLISQSRYTSYLSILEDSKENKYR